MSFDIPGPSSFLNNGDPWAFSGRIGQGRIPTDIAELEGWYKADEADIFSDGAAQFTVATSEHLSIADNAALTAGNIDFTVCCWVYFDSIGINQALVSKWATGVGIDAEYILFAAADNKFYFYATHNGTTLTSAVASSFGTFTTGRWYFVLAYHNATTDQLGIEVNDLTSNTAAFNSAGIYASGAQDFRLGASQHNGAVSNYLDGRLDSVAVYKRLLTTAEKTWLFNNGVGRTYSNIGVANTGGSDLKTSLAAWWDLDELSSTRQDAYGANDLTDNNTVTNVSGVSGKTGQFTSANSEYLSIADNAALSVGDEDFTIAAWVYLDDKAATQFIVSKNDTGTPDREYGLSYQAGGTDRFQFHVSNDGTASVTVDADNLGSPSATTWYYVVAWHDASANTINIQINGDTADSTAHTTGVNDGASPFVIGADNEGGGNYANGRICLVGFWKRTLSAAEKTWLYNNGLGQTYVDFGVLGTDGVDLKTDLQGFWPLDEVSGTRSDAYSTNNLTDNNTVTFNTSFKTALGEYLQSGSAVSRWVDRSGNKRDLIQATQSKRPQYVTNVLNSNPVVRYDGADDYIQASTASDWTFLHNGTGCTAIVVAKVASGITNDYFSFIATHRVSAALIGMALFYYDDDAANLDIFKVLVAKDVSPYTINHSAGNNTMPPGTWKILTWTWESGISGNDSNLYSDGTLLTGSETVGTPHTDPPDGPLTVGALTDTTWNLDGDIAEIILFSKVLSAGEKAEIETYLSDKYGI